ncbi:MAG: AmmeMemoRadiSam system protein B [Gammaproteobacteria bacterium]|nr:AmmeMemoRadiSam system protein B [Gammaproteobacteria bacterium]
MHKRKAAVAGIFYPEDPQELESSVLSYLQTDRAIKYKPKAMIVPHAGYIYSGAVAGSAYASLKAWSDTITRVVLLGPNHRVPLMGLAVSSADSFLSPLGAIDIDQQAIEMISSLPQVHTFDDAHLMEHSLEVQLPFLQLTLEQFLLVPVVVGNASTNEVSEVLDLLWGGDETLIIISSDLSHFHDYKTAQHIDKQTSSAIESLSSEPINPENACGSYPINGLLEIARKKEMQVEMIDLKNSGDTAGSKDQVVGYGAYIFH